MGNVTFTLPIKLVSLLARNFTINNFIETGTAQGNTTAWAADHFKTVYTIEIDSKISANTKNKINATNIEYIVGDSKIELPKLISRLQGKSLFFLDTHSISENGEIPTNYTLLDDLKTISKLSDVSIIINDIERFYGPLPSDKNGNNRPNFDQVYSTCKELFKDSYITIIDGVLLCMPKEAEALISTYWTETYDERFYEPEEIEEPVKRSFFERAVSKTKKEFKKKLTKSKPVAYKIENSAWFQNQCDIFYNSHKWLQEENFKSIVDIGANVGQFGKKIRLFYPEAKLYSFEPIPFVFEELEKNFKGDNNFKGFNVGLGDSNGTTKFYLNDFSDSSSMLKIGDLHKKNYPFTKHEQEINVEVRTLDNCLKQENLQKPYLVKLDVQGFEKQVIEGGLDIIRDAEMIISETSYKVLYENQVLFSVIYDMITELGFEYIGNLDQMNSTINGEPLQGDAIFKKIKK